VTDATGVYDVATNPGGWGSPNPDYDSSGLVISMEITASDGTVTQINDLEDQVTSTVTGAFTYNDIEVDLPDGWTTIEYTVATDSTSVSTTIKIFTYCKIQCCVFNKMLDMRTFDLCEEKEKIAAYMHMWMLYKALQFAANGCNDSAASDILSRLKSLCEVSTSPDCGCK
jgi:hypothetical protein